MPKSSQKENYEMEKLMTSHNWLGIDGLDDRLPGVICDGNLVAKYIQYADLQSYNKEELDSRLKGVEIAKGPGNKKCWIYAWLVPSESHKQGRPVVKIGAASESPWNRNEGEQSDACEAMLFVMESTHWDSYYHGLLKKGTLDGVEWLKNNRHDERFAVRDPESLIRLFAFLEDNNGVSTKGGRKPRHLYNDSYKVFEETMSEVNKLKVKGIANIVWELPPRWGKTLSGLCFINSLPVKFAFVTSYINTVCKSWEKSAKNIEGFQNILWVNPDDIPEEDEDEWLKDMVDHYKGSKWNKIVYYISLTGSAIMNKDGELIDNTSSKEEKNYERRIRLAKKFFDAIGSCETMIVVDEADFGAKCKRQVSKLRNLVTMGECLATLCMTGTNAESAKKIFCDGGCDIFVRRTIPDMWDSVAENKKMIR